MTSPSGALRWLVIIPWTPKGRDGAGALAEHRGAVSRYVREKTYGVLRLLTMLTFLIYYEVREIDVVAAD